MVVVIPWLLSLEYIVRTVLAYDIYLARPPMTSSTSRLRQMTSSTSSLRQMTQSTPVYDL